MIYADKLKIIHAFGPSTNGGGFTGDYISLKNVVKCWVVLHFNDTGAAATAAITLENASVVAGSDDQAITQVVPIWSNLDCATADTLTSQSAAVSYTTDNAQKYKIVLLEVDPSKLDAGFDVLVVKVGVSSASNYVGGLYICEMRYSSADVITD